MTCPLCGSFLHHSFIAEVTRRNVYRCTWSAHQTAGYFWVTDGRALRQVKAVKVGDRWEVN